MNATPAPEVSTPDELPARLTDVRDEVRDELRRADQKATTLISVVGATLAGVVALTGRDLPTFAVVLLWCAALPISASVLLLLSAIRPRLNSPQPGTWLHAAQVTPAVFLTACHNQGGTGLAGDVCVLARIARTKYLRVRHALLMLTAGLLLLGAALTVAAVRGGA